MYPHIVDGVMNRQVCVLRHEPPPCHPTFYRDTPAVSMFMASKFRKKIHKVRSCEEVFQLLGHDAAPFPLDVIRLVISSCGHVALSFEISPIFLLFSMRESGFLFSAPFLSVGNMNQV